MQDLTNDAWRRAAWTLFASLLVHVVFAAVLLSLPNRDRARPKRLNSVSVEIVSRQAIANARSSPKQSARVPHSASRSADPGTMVKATELFAARALAEPSSKQVRETLPRLNADERLMQLCNLEAIEQIEHWMRELRPETIISYARADATVTGRDVEAPGAAFLNQKHWYELAFNCEVSPDLVSVVSFEFRVGRRIPAGDWERFGLTDGGPPLH